jgi:hypothetical protein
LTGYITLYYFAGIPTSLLGHLFDPSQSGHVVNTICATTAAQIQSQAILLKKLKSIGQQAVAQLMCGSTCMC